MFNVKSILKKYLFIKIWKNFIFKFLNKKIYNFPGGIQSSPMKEDLNKYMINYVPNSHQFFIYLKYNTLKKNMLRIKINQKVLCGEPLTFGDMYSVPVHSPTSGWVKSIEFYSSCIGINKDNIKIIIISDYLDQWVKLKKIKNYKLYSSESLIKIIYQLGIVGLGGGQFSSAKKLMLSIDKKSHTLIVNAVESDPYITADYCLMHNYLNEIFIGCKIISWICKIKNIFIVIQEDKIELIKKIQNLIKNKKLFKIYILKKKYPGGSSKIIIKSLLNKEIPHGKHAIDLGYLIFNIATVYAIKRAIINGEPLIQKIVSIYDYNNNISKNFLIKLGTPIRFLLNYLKIMNYLDYIIYIGGMFMKDLLTDLNYSISKNMNSILIKKYDKNINQSVHYPCINCGYCVQVCPVNLLPQKLYIYSINNNHIKTKQSYIMDCIECKLCEHVCPSNIALVKYFTNEKKIQNEIDIEVNQKKIFFHRFQNREKRISSQNKIFYNMNDVNNEEIINTNVLQKSLKQEIINKKLIEKNIRKSILKSSLERAKLKNKTLSSEL